MQGILIFGGHRNTFTIHGKKHFLTANGEVYPYAVIIEAAKSGLFNFAPVHNRHAPQRFDNINRLRSGRQKVGQIGGSWWSAAAGAVIGQFIPEAHFIVPIGQEFSMSVNARTVNIDGYDYVKKINKVLAVDFVDQAACGGTILPDTAFSRYLKG